MTREEFGILAKSMKAVYSDPKFLPDSDAFDVWYGLLSDLDYRIAMAGVKKHMLTSRFAPTIAEIRERCAEISMGDIPSPMEAWAMYRKAISHASDSQNEFDKLPPIVQKAVGSPENIFNAGMSTNFNEDVARSNFLKSYDVAIKREKEYHQMTPDVRRITERTADRLEG